MAHTVESVGLFAALGSEGFCDSSEDWERGSSVREPEACWAASHFILCESTIAIPYR